jgi:hypothetical protein
MHELDEAINEGLNHFKHGMIKGQLMQLDFIESQIRMMKDIEDLKKYIWQEKQRIKEKENQGE